jgi:hypothetical protein
MLIEDRNLGGVVRPRHACAILPFTRTDNGGTDDA